MGPSAQEKNNERGKVMTKRKQKKKVTLASLQQINLQAAGMDIGAEEIWVCVPESVTADNIHCFGTFTTELQQLATWLEECAVTTVAMESTGIYWIPIYEILEARGIEVCLVNAYAVRNVSGRKSDVLDCQWIQQLHTYGLLKASFRPSTDISRLRTYVRQRESIIRQRSSQIQRIQKTLHLMNVKLTTVVTDITGLTGMRILRSILASERDSQQLAQFRDPRCKASEGEIAAALTGNYRQEYLFTLRQAVAAYDFHTEQLAECETEIEQQYAVFEPQVDVVEQPLPKLKRRLRVNHPTYDLRTYLYCTCGVDLTAVDGLNSLLVQDIIAEVGTDMSRWPTVKHFASWLGLSPNNKASAGKIKSRHTKKTSNRASTAFRLAAQAAGRTATAIGAFYRRIRAKHGAPVAITATAHKIARIVYYMLKEKTPFRPQSDKAYSRQQRQRYVKRLQHQAKKLGMQLVPNPAVS